MQSREENTSHDKKKVFPFVGNEFCSVIVK